jgi:hypothetical protein
MHALKWFSNEIVLEVKMVLWALHAFSFHFGGFKAFLQVSSLPVAFHLPFSNGAGLSLVLLA